MKMKRDFFQAPNFVFDAEITQQEKLTLLYLLRCSDHNGICYPSYEKICEKCNMSRPTAIKSIKKLIELGYIIKESKGYSGEYGIKRANTYKINF